MAIDADAPQVPLRRRQWGRLTLRVLVGVIFCVSAVAKLVAIDDFELYIYSYGLLPLSMSYVVARLCIGWELVLGGLLLTGWWKRLTQTVALLTMVAFSLFLCYAALVGRNESCECMGRLVEMTPAVSLLKNGVLIVLVLLGVKENGAKVMRKKWKVIVAAVAGALLMAMPFVLSVPDSWGFGPNQEPYGEMELKMATDEGGALMELGVGNGRKLVAFVTPRCPYCKLARKKLEGLVKRHDLERKRVVFVEPGDIGEELWIKITYGARPLMLLMDGQEVLATYHLRNVDEDEVAEFLKGNG